MRRKYASQDGVALVEFAIILPLLLLITFGIIEFGFLMYNQQMITNASREGARAGIVAIEPRLPPTGTDSIDSAVQKYCLNNLVTFGTYTPPTTTVTGYSASAPFRSDLVVKVTYKYTFLVLPNFISGLNNFKNLESTSVMRYE